MSDSKTCPFCSEEIKATAIKCRYCHSSLDGEAPLSASPTTLGEVGAYKILGLVGRGGMGTVYRCRHRNESMAERQGGDVCIKTMHAHYADDPVFQDRFEREASLGLKLDHPGIIKVHDLVMDAGTLALVMEYVEGRTLDVMIGRETGPIPWERARPMFLQLLEAMGHAHQQGIIHRDMKPENVMVTPDGRLKILDFGIAKEAGSGATKTGSGMGTADYMAPEQHTDAKNVDQRADIFALGMTLYEMLAGCLPWGGELDVVGVLMHKQNGDIPPPTDFYPGIPARVVAVIMAALSPRREGRPASVDALRRELAAASKQSPTPARSAKPAPSVARPAPTKAVPRGTVPVLAATPAPMKPLVWVVAAIVTVMLAIALISFLQTEDDPSVTATIPPQEEAGADDDPSTADVKGGQEPGGENTEPATATVKLRSSVKGGTVLMDGRKLDGKTPMKISRITSGRHKIEVRLSGWQPWIYNFEIGPGQTLDIMARLHKVRKTPSRNNEGRRRRARQKTRVDAENAEKQSAAEPRKKKPPMDDLDSLIDLVPDKQAKPIKKKPDTATLPQVGLPEKLSEGQIRNSMNKIKGRVQACYDQYQVAGNARVKLTITNSGKPNLAEPEPNRDGYPTLG